MKKAIGKRVEQIRNTMGMNKVEFAKIIGLTDSYLGTVERGVNGLTIEKAIRISEESGVSLDYLLTGRRTPKEIKAFSLSSQKGVLCEMSVEQIQIVCELLNNIAVFLKTDNVNELLLKSIFQSRAEPGSMPHTKAV